jgi:hypothetical protein
MMNIRTRRAALIALVALVAGCGGSNGTTTGGTTTGNADGDSCLTPAQVEQKVDEIASGVEGSAAEVERKQQQIRDVRARECP